MTHQDTQEADVKSIQEMHDEEKRIEEGFNEWRAGHHPEVKAREKPYTRHQQLVPFFAGARWQQRQNSGRNAK